MPEFGILAIQLRMGMIMLHRMFLILMETGMFRTCLGLLVFVIWLFIYNVNIASSQTIPCDTMYETVQGDSLSKIAGQAYGRTTAYQKIFDYNPGKLESPSRVPIGIALYIPCEQSGQNIQLHPIQKSRSNNIKILTGAEYPPYVDKGLENGGFSFELVERALQYGSGKTDYRIDVINDWGSHLQPLIEDGAYDLGFPWFQPDCSQLSRLGKNSRWRCNNLRFSEPLHEVVITFYGRAGEVENISSPEDAHGLKLCRPGGYFTHDLEVMGLVPPAIIRVAGDSPTDCFNRLVKGEVDLVSVNADTSDQAITELNIDGKVSEVIELASIQTLHVVGLKTNPKTRVNLLRVNKGVISLRKDGTFVQLAARHLGN